MTSSDLPQVLDEMHSYIRRSIAAGFKTTERIVEGVVLYLGNQADPALLQPHAERMVSEVLEQHLRDQAEWPAITDCDRLDLAFALLERAGVVCRQNFSCCGSCGRAEICGEIAHYESIGAQVLGYAFYHQQDTDSAVEDGGGLYLAYGAVEGSEEAGMAIGRKIEAAFEQYGLETSWNGRLSQRIFVEMNWQRRRLVA